MKTKNNGDLQVFLKKVMFLRGFGDMDSYKVITEYKEIAQQGGEGKLDSIIADFSDPKTYEKGKKQLIKEVKQSIDQQTFLQGNKPQGTV